MVCECVCGLVKDAKHYELTRQTIFYHHQHIIQTHTHIHKMVGVHDKQMVCCVYTLYKLCAHFMYCYYTHTHCTHLFIRSFIHLVYKMWEKIKNKFEEIDREEDCRVYDVSSRYLIVSYSTQFMLYNTKQQRTTNTIQQFGWLVKWGIKNSCMKNEK